MRVITTRVHKIDSCIVMSSKSAQVNNFLNFENSELNDLRNKQNSRRITTISTFTMFLKVASDRNLSMWLHDHDYDQFLADMNTVR